MPNTSQVLPSGQVAMTFYDGYGVSLYEFGAVDTYCEPKTHCELDEFTLYTTCEHCPPGTTNPAGEPIDASEAEETDGGVLDDLRGCEPTICDFDEQVVNNAFVACPAGSTNASGDNAADTILTSTTLTDEVVVDPVWRWPAMRLDRLCSHL